MYAMHWHIHLMFSSIDTDSVNTPAGTGLGMYWYYQISVPGWLDIRCMPNQ